MLTPENAGCPKCFAPLSEQIIWRYVAHYVEIENGFVGVGGVIEFTYSAQENIECTVCGEKYHELRERNAHDMAAYVAAQEKKKDIAARKAQSKKKSY